MTDPKVSMGLPVYNGEDFLEETLSSILGQTYGDFELIISDNASTDGTEEICRRFAANDERVRYSRNGRNVGIVRNFNILQQLARGEYFKWAAHDDPLASNYLEQCVTVLEEDPSIVMVSPRVKLVDSTGDPLPFDDRRREYVTAHGEFVSPIPSAPGASSREPVARFRSVVLDVSSSLLNSFTYGLYRSDVLSRTRLFEPYVGSEKVLLAQVALEGRLYELPQELFSWRIHAGHSGSASVSQLTRRMDPNWSGRFTFMGARQIAGYLRVVANASISVRQKLACLEVLVLKVFQASIKRTARSAK